MNLRESRLCLCLTIFCFCTVPAQTFTVMYGFPNVTTSSGSVDPGPAPPVAGLSFGTFTAAGVSPNPSASSRFSFSGWPVGAPDASDNYATYTAALSPFSYYEVAIGILPGYTLDLTSVYFDVRRSGTGIRNFSVRSDRDNYTENLSANTGTNANLGVIPDDVFFWRYDSIPTGSDQKGCRLIPPASFSGLTQEVRLRFYAWNAESPGGTFSIDNVGFTGIVMDSAMVSGVSRFPLEKASLFDILYGEDPGFTVRVQHPGGTLTVSDLKGRKLNECIPAHDEIFVALPPGVYLVELMQDGRVQRRKALVR
jgi:hypothetical protein